MTLYYVITGRVQGVGYRMFVRERAQQLNLTGWVRNTFDDKVEAVAQGGAAELMQFKEYLLQGPMRSAVKNINVSEVLQQNFEGFSIRS